MKKTNKIIWAIYLNHRCNLNCEYCYLKSLNESKRVNLGTLKKIIDRITVLSACQRRLPEIGFFGKEPLLNFELIKLAVKYIKSKNYKCSLSINTNGILLDKHKLEFLIENNFRIVLSSDFIISRKDNIAIFRDYNKDRFHIRTTISSLNLFMLPKIIEAFYKEGYKKLSISFDFLDRGLESISVEEIADKFTESLLVYLNIIKYDDGFSVPLLERIIQAGSIYSKKVEFNRKPFCHLGEKILSVDIDGGLYPCWRFVVDEKYKIGNLLENIIHRKRYTINLNYDYIKIKNFDFVCYWAYLKGGLALKNNLKILQAMEITFRRIGK
ncbi:MAG: radical SAM protein [Deltaproteobacteria bacterium]|nr:radical SAM protein [Deltaproteobacteria bacterium]